LGSALFRLLDVVEFRVESRMSPWLGWGYYHPPLGRSGLCVRRAPSRNPHSSQRSLARHPLRRVDGPRRAGDIDFVEPAPENVEPPDLVAPSPARD